MKSIILRSDISSNVLNPNMVRFVRIHCRGVSGCALTSKGGTGWYIGDDLGRIRKAKPTKAATANSDRWGFNQSTTLSFTGRHVLPIWRILKADATLQQYTFEHVVYHILRQRSVDSDSRFSVCRPNLTDAISLVQNSALLTRDSHRVVLEWGAS